MWNFIDVVTALANVGRGTRCTVLDHATHANGRGDFLVVSEAGCACILLPTEETAWNFARLTLFCGVQSVCISACFTNAGVSTTFFAV